MWQLLQSADNNSIDCQSALNIGVKRSSGCWSGCEQEAQPKNRLAHTYFCLRFFFLTFFCPSCCSVAAANWKWIKREVPPLIKKCCEEELLLPLRKELAKKKWSKTYLCVWYWWIVVEFRRADFSGSVSEYRGFRNWWFPKTEARHSLDLGLSTVDIADSVVSVAAGVWINAAGKPEGVIS